MGKKPTKIKKLEGTYRKDRAPKNEMDVPLLDKVEVPSGLINDFASSEWIKQTKILSSLDMLAETDTSILLSYCNEIGKYFECQEILKEKGYTTVSVKTGYEQQRPEVSIGNSALDKAIKLSDKFGFNPAARTKIEMPQKPKGGGLGELL